ncbi:bifunctional riboflavin kinase/FAD synthetase [Alkalihalobacillus sp. MEB130]|uniref:bifunctional riboflavin kinase/FAD synthetase n=1 Tax=Alkalihalobacillus sp. MEB130 TaxID=2976704 RepID=UPI0028DE1586|nr:bifunctional riboflavin kinase/FAD synthetase [Alkalihalobacillus sp. MEB130]MDT8858981.1 bifunctional riboflavin kinase/FAD synthetase [Alkalihalobacillus sp. MEB130]
METIYLNHPIDEQTLHQKKSVMALGYFDGVHIGHQAVIKQAIKIAKDLGVSTSVMTFHPHPKEVLRKTEMNYITPLPDKIKKIEKLGIDTLYVVNFTTSFASLTPQQFVDHYLIGLQVVHAVAGFDFTYGALGKGTMETLPFHARNRLDSTVVRKHVAGDDEKVSSTKIRQLLDNGDVASVTELLGEEYKIRGTVVNGEKRGRTIGFPTANVEPIERYIIPRTGVYAVRLTVDKEQYNGVCNIGFKPTFHNEQESTPTIEVHLFSFDKDIYGLDVEIQWHSRIRSEKKFAGFEQLVEQIKRDKEAAESLLNSKVYE